MTCYLLHFLPSYKHAAHYLGWSPELMPRIHAHQHGRGARLTQVAVAAGCELVLVRVWPDGDRTLERKLKAWHNGGAFCPICQGRPVQLPLLPWEPAYVPTSESQEQPGEPAPAIYAGLVPLF